MKKWLMYAGLFLAGVLLAGTVKPMLQNLPFIGGLVGGKTEQKEEA